MKTLIPILGRKAVSTFRLFTLIFTSLSISFFSKGQCYATATLSGSNVSNDNSVGTLAFVNPSNVLTSDNARTAATCVVSFFTGTSNYLKVTGFGFNIPSYAGICGVEVEIEKRSGGLSLGAWVRDNEVRLVKSNSVTGNNLGNTGADWGSSDAYYTHGNPNNLWGTTLTPAEVNASDFGVAVSTKFNGLLGIFPSSQIDHIRMIVYYNLVLPLRLISFSSALKNNITTLQWETADEEEGELLIVQRSMKGQEQWIDLVQYELHDNTEIKKHSYSDRLNTPGNYSYRLKITRKDLQIIYSEIRNIVYTGNNVPVIYPNPAIDFISIDNITDIKNISVSNLYWQSLNLGVEVMGEHSVRIDIRRLPKGIYFIVTGNYKMKFLKE